MTNLEHKIASDHAYHAICEFMKRIINNKNFELFSSCLYTTEAEFGRVDILSSIEDITKPDFLFDVILISTGDNVRKSKILQFIEALIEYNRSSGKKNYAFVLLFGADSNYDYGREMRKLRRIIEESYPDLRNYFYIWISAEEYSIEKYLETNITSIYTQLNFPSEAAAFRKVMDKPEFTSFNAPEVDLVIFPAHNEGFEERFLGEKRWYPVRIGKDKIKNIKYIALYRSAPVSGITHFAKVGEIKRYEDTDRYLVVLGDPIKLPETVKLGDTKATAMRTSRYTNLDKLLQANEVADLF